MCYLPPGPRCSKHAADELNRQKVALERESDVNKKLLRRLKVEEAQKQYNSTPKGQNDLKREIGLLSGATDFESQTKLLILKNEKTAGEQLRKAQLEAYKEAAEVRTGDIKTTVQSNNKHKVATGVVYNTILESLNAAGNTDRFVAHVRSTNLIEITDTTGQNSFKVLCLPEKYQAQWDTLNVENDGSLTSMNPYDTVNMTAFLRLLQTHLTCNYDALPPERAQLVKSWVGAYLEDHDIRFVGAVDRRTEQVMLFSAEDILEEFQLHFKLPKRLGGTTVYRGGEARLGESLKGSAFETGTILEVKNTTGRLLKTILLDVPPYPTKNCSVGNLFLSWRTPDGDATNGHYEVRVKHEPKQLDLVVCFNRRYTTQSVSDVDALLNALAVPSNN